MNIWDKETSVTSGLLNYQLVFSTALHEPLYILAAIKCPDICRVAALTSAIMFVCFVCSGGKNVKSVVRDNQSNVSPNSPVASISAPLTDKLIGEVRTTWMA